MMTHTIAMKHAVPTASRVLDHTAREPDYVDSFRVELRLSEPLTVDYLMARVFASMPSWFYWLLAVRDVLVAAFGLKTGGSSTLAQPARDVRFEKGSKDSVFAVIDRNDEEVVMAECDKHLDFRVSVKASTVTQGATLLELTTVVWYNNWLGPVYFALVKPFHQALIRSLMKRASAKLVHDFGSGTEPGASTAQRIATWLALLGGLVVLGLGVAHFPLAHHLEGLAAIAQVSPAANDLLILLCLCVGILLILAGALSLYFAPRLQYGDAAARVFFFLLGLTELGRVVLDVLYPLTIMGAKATPIPDTLFVCVACFIPVFLAGFTRREQCPQ